MGCMLVTEEEVFMYISDASNDNHFFAQVTILTFNRWFEGVMKRARRKSWDAVPYHSTAMA